MTFSIAYNPHIILKRNRSKQCARMKKGSSNGRKSESAVTVNYFSMLSQWQLRANSNELGVKTGNVIVVLIDTL